MTDFQKLQQEFAKSSPFLTALGDEKRQAIIMALLAQGSCQGLRATELTAVTGLSRPAVSHHLKILQTAQLVAPRSQGTKNYWYLTHETTQIQQLRQLLQHVETIMKEHPQS